MTSAILYRNALKGHLVRIADPDRQDDKFFSDTLNSLAMLTFRFIQVGKRKREIRLSKRSAFRRRPGQKLWQKARSWRLSWMTSASFCQLGKQHRPFDRNQGNRFGKIHEVDNRLSDETLIFGGVFLERALGSALAVSLEKSPLSV